MTNRLKAIARPSADSLLTTVRQGERKSLPKVACIGSSYTSQQINSSGTNFNEARSWMRWWHIFSYGAFNMDNWQSADPRGHSGSNFGISGESSTLILARIGQVIASNPDYCVVQSGTNNITNTATVLADVKATIDALYLAGIVPIYLGINNRQSVSWSGNEPNLAMYVNQDIKSYMARTGRGIFVSSNDGLINCADANGRPLTNALDSDGIHYNQYSAFQIGKALHKAVTPLLRLPSPEITTIADVYNATDNPFGNILTNPFNSTDAGVGSGGGTVGTGVTAGSGVAATSVGRSLTVERNSGTGTAVATLEPISYGRGNKQVITITPAATAATSVFYFRRSGADLTTNLPPVGTWVQASTDVDVSAFGTDVNYSGFRAISNRLEARDAGASLGLVQAGSLFSNSFNLPNEAWSGRIYTAPFQIPTGFTLLRYRNEIHADDNMTGTGVVKFYNNSLRIINDPRPTWGF